MLGPQLEVNLILVMLSKDATLMCSCLLGVICKKNGESVDHLFFHCHFSVRLWHRLLQAAKNCWMIPASSFWMISQFVGWWYKQIVGWFQLQRLFFLPKNAENAQDVNRKMYIIVMQEFHYGSIWNIVCIQTFTLSGLAIPPWSGGHSK